MASPSYAHPNAQPLITKPESIFRLTDDEKAALLSMTARCEWQAAEAAPMDGTAVLLFHPSWDTLRVGICYTGAGPWQQPNGDLLTPFTHWMALPSPPGDVNFAQDLTAG